jgi:hypothetical protein
MKSLRQVSAAFVLTCVFATAALADDGVMHGDVVPPPPPTPASVPVSGNDIPLQTTSDDASTVDLTTEFMLSVLPRVVGWL